MHALTRHRPGFSKSKLHPHYSKISFPAQANNRAFTLQDTEARVLNLGPKFVPPAPEQVLERLPNEIQQVKEKLSTAWRKMTKTIGREPIIVKQFCERIEKKIRKTVTTEVTQDTTLKPTITCFQKIQKQKKVIFRETDKSKVFHANTRESYIKKSATYMEKLMRT
ncbi:unnamed protein product [Rotaria magnacalcarata]|uniref:Uncharacterized protein n=1 Tax=Rotaria magnacalcarata TaxID=392030 RepID=A0A819ZM73_9BILA|nr:unnamed protein product [Rotaria magnacalcarata]CAF4176699.1 unnamed protein product [Rotaria magnacalcarata]